MTQIKMTEHEYEFMTGRWKGVKGAAFNAVYDFCCEFGWVMGMSDHDEPIPTQKGLEAIKAYQANENYKRIDVI